MAVDTAAQTAKTQLDAERDRLSRRQRFLAIVEQMVESWTEEQTEAMLELATVWQAAAQTRYGLANTGRLSTSTQR
jgi:hypothetical protein